MGKISSKTLMEIFEVCLRNSATYRRLDNVQKNPAHIMFNGVELYVYIKNLSSAYFENPDVWRAQMTGVDVLNEIKESPAMFILLGYDCENNVYATWNPHHVKQRIGTASSPSFYSRLSLQQEVSRSREIKLTTLNNDLKVLVFPYDSLVDVLSSLDQFFPDTSDYVAMGSKRRGEANAAYKELTNTKRVDEYARFILKAGVSSSDVERLCQAIRRLINGNLISQHRKLFLAHDSLSEYKEAVDEFFKLDDVKETTEKWGTLYQTALASFVRFLQIPQQVEVEDVEEEGQEELVEAQVDDAGVADMPKDWEAAYEDENGKLTKLMNPELLKQLRPYLDVEYPSPPAAYNVIGDFYGNRYPKMQLKDWGRLIKEIDWSKCNGDGVIPETQNIGKRKAHILRVTFPNGDVIEDKNVSKTFVRVIERCTPNLVKELNIAMAGVDLVSDQVSEQYAKAQHLLNDGSYLMTHMSTDKKRDILQYISDSLELNLKVERILIESGEVVEDAPSDTKPFKLSSRQKIWVQFPDGSISNHAKVMQTLVDVVVFAGPERVKALGIMLLGDNLITPNLNPKYAKLKAYKDVGNGLYVNTASDTQKKFEQIKEIDHALKLNLIIRLD